MCRLQTIDKYYNNLQYNESNREEVLTKISALPKTIKFKNINDISERFLETASVIEKNLSLFQSVCKHVDVVTTIIEYLTNFGVKLSLCSNFEEEYEKDDIILLVMLTLVHICGDTQIHLFLEDAIYKNYGTYQYQWKHKCYQLIKDQFNEMILLEDSDLYAVISYLRIIYPKQGCLSSYFNKIWVQEFIKEKFLWLVKEYFENLTLPIYVFRSRKELLTNHEHCKMKIVSIWSEDIIAAKNLASYLNKEVLFINTHMDLYSGIVLLPYIKIFSETLNTLLYEKLQNCDVNNYAIKSETLKAETPTYNLFYNGKWQQPVENTYWMYNEALWAHATSCDIKRCIDSAEKGFKIWSTKSITSRNQILFKFASMLKCNGKFALADKILKWIKFSNIYETSLLCSQSGRLEITKMRQPKGVIILKEKDETVLFDRLTQVLIAGNSVIVICDGKDSCSLAQYCDKFSVSEIPSGVINLLSHDNLKTLEASLCATTYDSYSEQFFLKDNPEKTYINLTIPKYIILPIK
ncbi:Aldehyde dehydrogenase domain-containing protein [Camponotus japonicus]